MGDLINRSALINKIRGIVPGSQDVDFIVRLIGDQPTAFNMDAVVADIEDFREEAEQFGFASALSDIVEVVRNGGVYE